MYPRTVLPFAPVIASRTSAISRPREITAMKESVMYVSKIMMYATKAPRLLTLLSLPISAETTPRLAPTSREESTTSAVIIACALTSTELATPLKLLLFLMLTKASRMDKTVTVGVLLATVVGTEITMAVAIVDTEEAAKATVDMADMEEAVTVAMADVMVATVVASEVVVEDTVATVVASEDTVEEDTVQTMAISVDTKVANSATTATAVQDTEKLPDYNSLSYL